MHTTDTHRQPTSAARIVASLIGGRSLDDAPGGRMESVNPNYHPRFGFSANLAKNLSSRYSGEAFLALELTPGALSGVSGEFAFAPQFGAVS